MDSTSADVFIAVDTIETAKSSIFPNVFEVSVDCHIALLPRSKGMSRTRSQRLRPSTFRYVAGLRLRSTPNDKDLATILLSACHED
jgi:hypothetical protein